MRQLDSFIDDYVEMTRWEQLQLLIWFRWMIWRKKRHALLLHGVWLSFRGIFTAFPPPH